jgi:hypothetical protein
LSKFATESQELYDLVLEIEGKTFNLKQNQDQTWVVNDCNKDYLSDLGGLVKIQGVTYQIFEDSVTGSAQMKKLYAESIRVATPHHVAVPIPSRAAPRRPLE